MTNHQPIMMWHILCVCMGWEGRGHAQCTRIPIALGFNHRLLSLLNIWSRVSHYHWIFIKRTNSLNNACKRKLCYQCANHNTHTHWAMCNAIGISCILILSVCISPFAQYKWLSRQNKIHCFTPHSWITNTFYLLVGFIATPSLTLCVCDCFSPRSRSSSHAKVIGLMQR